MFNQFTGIGNLAADPESRFTASGTQVANFTVCCDSGYGDKKVTEFVRCVAWAKTAELAVSYMHKGSKVLIQGEMNTRKWTDNNGVDRYSTEITVRELRFLSPRSEGGQQQEQYPEPVPGMMGTGEDTPF